VAQQILVYAAPAITASGVNYDLTAQPDPSFTRRGGATGNQHFIFTEPYNLMATAIHETTNVGGQIFDATLNAINIPQIYPPNLGIVPPSNPQVYDLRDYPMPLPVDEEIQYQLSSGNSGGTEPGYAIIWIRPMGDSQMPIMPSPQYPRVKAIFTVTTTLTIGAWGPLSQITLTNPLKGGTYQVLGVQLVAAHALCFRITFVRPPTNASGRPLRPGAMVENAFGNIPLAKGLGWMGPYGSFNNFELPQIEVYGTTTETSATYTGFMDLIYTGGGMGPGPAGL
jgi:hypothetical protein